MIELDPKIKSVKAFAPATCANVAVGYDVLGFPFPELGDEVTLTRNDTGKTVIKAIQADETLPMDPKENVASAVIIKFCQEHNLAIGFDVTVQKGIPLGSGMGGSAASSVAALTALNGFFTNPLNVSVLAQYALYGEEIATGHKHADNAVPALFGGLTATVCLDPIDVIHLPIPDVFCVLVHPDLRIDTSMARQVLPESMALNQYVEQSRYITGFISALYDQDLDRLQHSLQDVLIEPHRSVLVKGFANVKQAALQAGALCASLSGSGPSLFAFIRSEKQAHAVANAMTTTFHNEGVEATSWVGKITKKAAYIVDRQLFKDG